MNVKITPGKAKGAVAVPPSKSMAHRLLICAGLSEGKSVIRGISDCEDVQATLDCLRALGARCEQIDDTVTVWGVDPRCATPKGTLRCRERTEPSLDQRLRLSWSIISICFALQPWSPPVSIRDCRRRARGRRDVNREIIPQKHRETFEIDCLVYSSLLGL